jgi:ankyrin repeat protein
VFIFLFYRRLPFTFLTQGKGANINENDNKGHTAFMIAALKGRKDVVEYLVVRINVRDKYIEAHAGADDGSL